MKKKNDWKYKQFLHVIMIQNNFKYVFATSVKYSDLKISPFIHKMAKIYPFLGRGFHTPLEWKIGFKVINKQTIVQILIVNTAFYISGNMRLKEINILNSFEQIQENTIAGSAFSARLGSSAVAFIPDPGHPLPLRMRSETSHGLKHLTRHRQRNQLYFSTAF